MIVEIPLEEQHFPFGIGSRTYSCTSPLFTPRLYRDGSTTSSSPLASSPTRESNLILLPFRFYFLLFTFPRVSFHPAAVPSIRSLSNAASGRTLSEVRSASASLRLQPWQLCPNWPTVWQDDCQLLSARAVGADVRQVWRAPDGSLRHEKESLSPLLLL